MRHSPPVLASIAALALAGCASLDAKVEPPKPTAALALCAAGAERMARVELIFGLRRAPGDGRDRDGVTEDQWRDFLNREVTPRFPDGLTVLDGYGQWRRPDNGRIAKIASKVLIIWYAPSGDAEANIQAIREAFKKRFDQLSVMRVDSEDCVSF